MKDITKGIVYLGVFAIPFIPLIISNSMFFPFITGKNFTFRVTVELIFAAWVILALYEPAYRPKFSWIFGSFTVFLAIMFCANLFGVNRTASFWSNFERMEGYVTLVHTFLYLVVAGSVLVTDKLWDRFFNTTLFAGVLLALYAFAQLAGDITINQGGWRLDGTLGNSAYMAIYTLFHAYIAFFMLMRTRSKGLKYTYGALVLLFVYLLIQTATRGTILGLILGLGVTTSYIAIFTKEYPRLRKSAVGGLIALVVMVGLFFTFRHSQLIQENPYLGRVANISLSEGNVRFAIWDMAIKGFKERPILGWGQSNFNYVFNKNYDPSLYYAEPWYDRVHDIFLDWLIAGGILGFLAYFSIFFATLYYLIVRPFREHDESFTVIERGVILGLLAGYLFHNIFVFDNIVSYIYYATFLAFIHARVAKPLPRIMAPKFNTLILDQIAVPVIVILAGVTVYFVNVPGILASTDIINAFREKDPTAILTQFDTALGRNSFAHQEIREQMTRQVQAISQSKEVSDTVKKQALARVEEQLLKEVDSNKNDARTRVFIASFYRMTGDTDKAIAQLKVARELSPNKQQIIFEQGLSYLQKNDYENALSYFKQAYDLATQDGESRNYYAIAALYDNKRSLYDELISTEGEKAAIASNDLILQAAYRAKQYDILKDVFNRRIVTTPNDPQVRSSLAFILNESGDVAGAVAVLKKAGDDIPSFKAQAEEYMKNIVSTSLKIKTATQTPTNQ